MEAKKVAGDEGGGTTNSSWRRWHKRCQITINTSHNSGKKCHVRVKNVTIRVNKVTSG